MSTRSHSLQYSKSTRLKAAFVLASENMIISIGAFMCGFFFTSNIDHSSPVIDGLWSVISGLLVWQSTPKRTLLAAKLRFNASFIGALIGGLYLVFLDFHVLGLGVCIGLGVFGNYIIAFQDGIRVTGVTIAVILLISSVNPDINPFVNASLRVLESFLGCLVAIGVSYIPIPPRYRFMK